MKTKACLPFLLTMLITIFSAGQASALYIDLGFSDTDITVGESFGVDVWAHDASITDPFGWPEGVIAFGFDVTTDPSIEL